MAGVAGQAEIRRFLEHALTLADEARTYLCAAFASGFEVKQKPDGSYVTDADVEAERRLRDMTRRAFPDHGLIGEEHGGDAVGAAFRWVFDPIDGTEDFVHRVPTFGTIIALYEGTEPLVGVLECPMLGLRVYGARRLGAHFRSAGQEDKRITLGDVDPAQPREAWRITTSSRTNFTRHRDDGPIFDRITAAYGNHRIYRSCLAHLLAITGQAEACIDAHNPIWDIAAARILAEEAGGVCRTVQRYEIGGEPMYSTVFGRRTAVDAIAALFQA